MEKPFFKSRDFDMQPYTPDEMRVVVYLQTVAPDVGAGDDPVGFILAAHNYLMRQATKDIVRGRSQ